MDTTKTPMVAYDMAFEEYFLEIITKMYERLISVIEGLTKVVDTFKLSQRYEMIFSGAAELAKLG